MATIPTYYPEGLTRAFSSANMNISELPMINSPKDPEGIKPEDMASPVMRFVTKDQLPGVAFKLVFQRTVGEYPARQDQRGMLQEEKKRVFNIYGRTSPKVLSLYQKKKEEYLLQPRRSNPTWGAAAEPTGSINDQGRGFWYPDREFTENITDANFEKWKIENKKISENLMQLYRNFSKALIFADVEEPGSIIKNDYTPFQQILENNHPVLKLDRGV